MEWSTTGFPLIHYHWLKYWQDHLDWDRFNLVRRLYDVQSPYVTMIDLWITRRLMCLVRGAVVWEGRQKSDWYWVSGSAKHWSEMPRFLSRQEMASRSWQTDDSLERRIGFFVLCAEELGYTVRGHGSRLTTIRDKRLRRILRLCRRFRCCSPQFSTGCADHRGCLPSLWCCYGQESRSQQMGVSRLSPFSGRARFAGLPSI